MTKTHDARRAPAGHWGVLTVLVAAMWLAAGALEFLLHAALGGPKGGKLAWSELLYGVSGFWGLAALLSPPLVWAFRRVPFERGQRLRSLATHFVALLCVIPVQALLRWLWMNATVWHYKARPQDIFFNIPLFTANFMGGATLVYVGVLGAVLAWDYYQRYGERERAAAALELEQARLRASLSEARLEALQVQLQPHFLFNSLHAISTLILKGETRGANEMLSHLSRFLRMTLDRAESPTLPLALELESLDAYLRIQRERFGDRLQVEMAIEDQALSAAVPNLVFQPLVENCLRHGIDSQAGAGRLMLRARVVGGRLVLEVEDDGRGLPEGEAAPEGIGLSNIRERLEQLYPGSHEFTLCRRPEGGATARIVIPYLIASPEPAARAD